jgi:hypothetical protein
LAVAIRETRAEKEGRSSACLFPVVESASVSARSVGGLPFITDAPTSEANYVEVSAARYYGLLREFQAAKIAAKALLLEEVIQNTTLPIVIDLLGAYHAETHAKPASVQLDEPGLERAFERLGMWGGPYSSRQGIRDEWDFWRQQGLNGISWLLGKVRHENGNETMNAVANVLANMGTSALSTILGHLQANPSPDQAYCLLDALSRLEPQKETDANRIAIIISKYVGVSDPDLRLAAVTATSVLPSASALEILDFALVAETDSTVRGIIHDEIRERRRG